MSYRPAQLAPGQQPDHCTAGAVLSVGGQVLLERRPEDSQVYAGCWDLPGGHVESGELPEQTLARELREELGIEVEKTMLVAVQDDRDRTSGRLYRHYVYLVQDFRGEVRARQEQVLEWWPLHEALNAEFLNPLAGWVLRLCLAEQWL